MNFSPSTTRRGRVRRIVRMLSILLVQQALIPGISEANMRSRLPGNRDAFPLADGSLPYLRITGALALRFGAPPPPPDISTKPAASAPPFPTSATPEPAAPVAPPSPAPTPTPSHSPAGTAPKPQEPTTTTTATPASAESPSSNPPPEILPDDTRPATRPEDFLPYFQFPGSNPDTNVPVPPVPPPPGQLPPSSATYQLR